MAVMLELARMSARQALNHSVTLPRARETNSTSNKTTMRVHFLREWPTITLTREHTFHQLH